MPNTITEYEIDNYNSRRLVLQQKANYNQDRAVQCSNLNDWDNFNEYWLAYLSAKSELDVVKNILKKLIKKSAEEYTARLTDELHI